MVGTKFIFIFDRLKLTICMKGQLSFNNWYFVAIVRVKEYYFINFHS